MYVYTYKFCNSLSVLRFSSKTLLVDGSAVRFFWAHELPDAKQ